MSQSGSEANAMRPSATIHAGSDAVQHGLRLWRIEFLSQMAHSDAFWHVQVMKELRTLAHAL